MYVIKIGKYVINPLTRAIIICTVDEINRGKFSIITEIIVCTISGMYSAN